MKQASKRILGKGLLAVAAGMLMGTSVLAQTFPSQPMRWIIPYAPGGTTDIMARTLAAKMSKDMGQTIVAENRPGAASAIGATVIARATPDGYTFGTVDSGTLAFNPWLYKNLTYNAEKDFTMIGGLGKMPLVLAVSPNFPAKNLKEFLELARKEPGKISSASSGLGSPLHVALELFKQRTGTNLLHVPYKGSAPALQDLMSGQVNSIFVDLPPSLALIRAGNVRVLAVAAPERLAALPDVPTMAEAGLAGFEANAWQVLVGPDKMPANIVSTISKQLLAAQNDPETRKRLEELGIIPLTMTPEVLTKFVLSEQKLWADVIKAAGIQPQD
jgi:tripartite-type tricarboxylate transporter receptor subunit TctC